MRVNQLHLLQSHPCTSTAKKELLPRGAIYFEMAAFSELQGSYSQSLSLYHKSAMNGYAPALNNLSVLLALGYNQKDIQGRPENWFKLAIQLGDELAKENMAILEHRKKTKHALAFYYREALKRAS